MWQLIVVLLIVVAYFVITYSVSARSYDGYYYATSDYLAHNDMVSAAVYIKGSKLAVMFNFPSNVFMQVYRLTYDGFGYPIVKMMFGDGEPIFGVGNLRFTRKGKILRITGGKSGGMLFKGLRIG